MKMSIVTQQLTRRTGPFDVARARPDAARTNFYYAFVFLSSDKRRAIEDIYAFCRLTDDLVDDAPDPAHARARLSVWRDEFDRACRGHGQTDAHPIAARMAVACRRFQIDPELPRLLIEGCRMDLVPPEYQTVEELDNYCYHVASSVGLMCIEVFGYRNPSARDYAVNLGMALQRTNILRDLRADAVAGRVYLPDESLRHCGLTHEQLLVGPPEHAAAAQLIRQECRAARSLYAAAAAALAPEDRWSLVCAEIMAAVYARLLDEIEKAGARALVGHVSLSRATKLGVAVRTFARALAGV